MTNITDPSPEQREKWHDQAERAAAILKGRATSKDALKIGFAFDDAVITIDISARMIRDFTAAELGREIYRAAINAAG